MQTRNRPHFSSVSISNAVIFLSAAFAASTNAFAAPDSPEALADAFCAAVIAEDSVAMAALYTDDAVSYGPGGETTTGASAIGNSWAPFFDGFTDLTCHLESGGLLVEADSAAAWGEWTMTGKSTGSQETVTMNGRYTDVMIKTTSGWLYKVDHASMAASGN